MHDEKPALHPPPRPTVEHGGVEGMHAHKDDIFFAAIEMTRMPMLVTDPRQPDNPIIFVNRAFLSMSQYEMHEVIGRNCRMLQGPDTDPDAVAAIRNAVAQRAEISLELLNYRKDGSSFWNALFVSPVYSHDGELVYFFASQLDVSRRHDAEEALSQAQKMEALGHLTGGISHDFNNLLQVMSAQVDVLRMKARRGQVDLAELESGLGQIRAAIDKAARLTQQLLSFSRKQQLRSRVINLNGTVSAMDSMIRTTLGEATALELELDPSLPNCAVDNTQLEVALLNLVVNARDAMDGGGTLRVRTQGIQIGAADSRAFRGLPAGRYATVAVTDTGCGIAPEILGRVMDPFFTTKEEGKGTGLGLSSVYGFAKQSGGTTTIYSEPGIGTTVRMYFPATEDRTARASTNHADAELRGGDELVVVVDDREEIATLAAEMLRSVGYRVLVAHSGLQALQMIRDQPPNEMPQLLFSDVVMPGGMNGYMLAQEVRHLLPHIGVLLATGFDRDLGHMAEGMGAQFDVMKKPYQLADLVRRVRMVLDGIQGPKL